MRAAHLPLDIYPVHEIVCGKPPLGCSRFLAITDSLSWKGTFLAQLFVLVDNLKGYPKGDGLEHSCTFEG